MSRRDAAFPLHVFDAASGAEAMKILTQKSGDIQCVLLDQDMPGGPGLKWLRRMLALDRHLAVIMVTGKGSEELAVEAMKAGAVDYLVKGGIEPECLQKAILNAVEKMQMTKTIKEQREKLLQAERHRVMIESLGAACHHLGQPATVLGTYLQMIEARESDPETGEMITQCIEAWESMSDILKQFMEVTEYRVEPYLATENCEKILKI